MHSLARGKSTAIPYQAASNPTQESPSTPAFQKLMLHQAPCSCLLYLGQQPGLEDHQHLSHHRMSCSTSWRALKLSTQKVDREGEEGGEGGQRCASTWSGNMLSKRLSIFLRGIQCPAVNSVQQKGVCSSVPGQQQSALCHTCPQGNSTSAERVPRAPSAPHCLDCGWLGHTSPPSMGFPCLRISRCGAGWVKRSCLSATTSIYTTKIKLPKFLNSWNWPKKLNQAGHSLQANRNLGSFLKEFCLYTAFINLFTFFFSLTWAQQEEPKVNPQSPQEEIIWITERETYKQRLFQLGYQAISTMPLAVTTHHPLLPDC